METYQNFDISNSWSRGWSSHVLKAFQVAQRRRNDAVEQVVWKIECLKFCESSKFSRNWSCNVIILHKSAKIPIPLHLFENSSLWQKIVLQGSSYTYIIWRFVKFPVLGDKVPDKFWLGIPLHDIINLLIKSSLNPQETEEIKTRTAYSPITRLSEEQVTIVQLHGSTASPSQFSRTPWGSLNADFIPIKAWTKYTTAQMRKTKSFSI